MAPEMVTEDCAKAVVAASVAKAAKMLLNILINIKYYFNNFYINKKYETNQYPRQKIGQSCRLYL
jgi:hypothetical protein